MRKIKKDREKRSNALKSQKKERAIQKEKKIGRKEGRKQKPSLLKKEGNKKKSVAIYKTKGVFGAVYFFPRENQKCP